MDKVNTNPYEFLIETHQRLVYKIARRFRVNAFDFDDLVQAGFMGLLKAAHRYDVTRGNQFSTFATYYIIGAIKDELKRNSLIKSSKYYQQINHSEENNTSIPIDESDRLVAEQSNTVILQENFEQVRGEYFSIEQWPLTDLEKELVKLRLQRHYTQNKIAESLGMSQSKVSRILKNIKNVILLKN